MELGGVFFGYDKYKEHPLCHWAALNGKADVPYIYPLDTGCVWGNCLTAMRLEDEKRFSVSCA